MIYFNVKINANSGKTKFYFELNLSPMKILAVLFSTATAMIGYHIHNSIFWSIMDFIFSVLAWVKWLICQEVNLTIIKETFSFFLS